MKQIPITPDLTTKIQAVAGADVDPSGFAVFEAIALNTLPLTGKRGSLFQGATITPLTLRQMQNYILENGVPLCEDHDTDGPPLGKVFDAQYLTDTNGLSLSGELRVLFYLDPTETVRITKLNAGVIDEVSVGLLSSALLCSECGWDYMGEDAGFDNIISQTCANGHVIGTDGTHAILSGLDRFYELSLVTSGAADNAKIVGKSAAKLPSAASQRLAARGFEVSQLALAASKGEYTVDFEKLVAQLTEKSAAHATVTAELTALKAANEATTAQLTSAKTELTTLNAAAAEAVANKAEVGEARALLTDTLKAMMAAHGETAPEKLPETVPELKAAIESRTKGLTKLIPVGGSGAEGAGSGTGDAKPTVNTAAFKLNK